MKVRATDRWHHAQCHNGGSPPRLAGWFPCARICRRHPGPHPGSGDPSMRSRGSAASLSSVLDPLSASARSAASSFRHSRLVRRLLSDADKSPLVRLRRQLVHQGSRASSAALALSQEAASVRSLVSMPDSDSDSESDEDGGDAAPGVGCVKPTTGESTLMAAITSLLPLLDTDDPQPSVRRCGRPRRDPRPPPCAAAPAMPATTRTLPFRLPSRPAAGPG